MDAAEDGKQSCPLTIYIQDYLPSIMNIRRKKDYFREKLDHERNRIKVDPLDRDRNNTQFLLIDYETIF